MRAHEFKEWMDVFHACPESGDDNLSAEAELAWRAMNRLIDDMDYEADPGLTIGEGIAWATFWIAVAAVLVALIVALAS